MDGLDELLWSLPQWGESPDAHFARLFRKGYPIESMKQPDGSWWHRVSQVDELTGFQPPESFGRS